MFYLTFIFLFTLSSLLYLNNEHSFELNNTYCYKCDSPIHYKWLIINCSLISLHYINTLSKLDEHVMLLKKMEGIIQ